MSLFGMFKRPDQKPMDDKRSEEEAPLFNEGKIDYMNSRVEEKPTLAEEAESRGMINVHSWEDIHLHDIQYFEKEIRDIFNLGDNEDVIQAIMKKAREGFSFGLGIIAKYYGLPPGATFEEIKAKKLEKENSK